MDKVVRESAFIFDGIKTKKAQKKIVNLLKCCKELRDTAYPLKNSLVTEVKLLDLHAQKQKDYTYVTGTLLLEDLPAMEKRTFEAYITNKDNEYHILLDITRVDAKDLPNMIRTTDIIREEKENIISVTSYCGIGYLHEKVFSQEFTKEEYEANVDLALEQISAL